MARSTTSLNSHSMSRYQSHDLLLITFLPYYTLVYSLSDTSEEDEMDDQDVQKIIIVTQTPPAFRKHPGGDRTGNFISRPKMTTDVAATINDGLYFYEQVDIALCTIIRVGMYVYLTETIS